MILIWGRSRDPSSNDHLLKELKKVVPRLESLVQQELDQQSAYIFKKVQAEISEIKREVGAVKAAQEKQLLFAERGSAPAMFPRSPNLTNLMAKSAVT